MTQTVITHTTTTRRSVHPSGQIKVLVPQHLADRFQRHALRKRDRRGKGMPGDVDRGVE